MEDDKKPDGSRSTVGIVVPCFNQGRFLEDALRSIEAQTRRADQVIVIDDGSTEELAPVVAHFPAATLIRQENRGLASARNAGLQILSVDKVLFLDADDVLTPNAIKDLMHCFESHPASGMVYGGFRMADAHLTPTGMPQLRQPVRPFSQELLKWNLIGMHGAVLYDRAKLIEVGAFDESLARCEDYDAYLRMAKRYPVSSQRSIVALYRKHGENMSKDGPSMLDWALAVHARHRPSSDDKEATAVFRAGQREWRLLYAQAAWNVSGPDKWRNRWAMARRAPAASAVAAVWAGLQAVIPRAMLRRLKSMIGRGAPAVGTIDFGSFARRAPVSPNFGFDRGTPVDRNYIEWFLQRHASDIKGRVLEIGDATYSNRFGQGIARQDVLHVDQGHPGVTIVGDLARADLLPGSVFDCMVLTQTLHLIFDMAGAVQQVRRALKPGGVALVTVPGVSSVDRGEWGGTWYWSLTGSAARRLFEDEFGAANVDVTVRGNVFAATTFLHGLAVEELDPGLLEGDDPAYPVVICIRARRDD